MQLHDSDGVGSHKKKFNGTHRDHIAQRRRRSSSLDAESVSMAAKAQFFQLNFRHESAADPWTRHENKPAIPPLRLTRTRIASPKEHSKQASGGVFSSTRHSSIESLKP